MLLTGNVWHLVSICLPSGLCYGPGVEVCYTSQEVFIVLSSPTQKTVESSVDATVCSLKLQVHLINYAHRVRNFLPMPA